MWQKMCRPNYSLSKARINRLKRKEATSLCSFHNSFDSIGTALALKTPVKRGLATRGDCSIADPYAGFGGTFSILSR